MIRKLRIGALCALILAAAAGGVRSDDAPKKDYVLGIDDVIEISVADHPELTKQLQIMPDGKIAYIEVGEIQAAGKTPAALAADIKTALERGRNNVQVVVSVITPKSLRVRVVGAVRSPGVYDYRRGMRALDLIASASGLTARAARVRARVLGANGEVREISLDDALSQPDGPQNPELAVGDLLLIDEVDPLANKAYVMGRIKNPGAYDLGDEGRGLLSILAEAGSPEPDAALTQCRVIRGNQEIPVNLMPALIQGKADDPVKGFILQPGDMIFIPRNESVVSIMGSVAKAGQYPLREDQPTTVMEALGLAGGPTATANPKDITVVRMVGSEPLVTRVDLDHIRKKKDFAMNIPLQKGDILFVPAKGEGGFKMSDILSPVTALFYLTRIGR